jgi:Protein of unknown function (DUF3570)
VAVINRKAKKRCFKESLIKSFGYVQESPVKGIKRFLKKPDRASLHALTTAALVLPGLMLSTAQAADDDEVDFQYSHYQEGKRNLGGAVNDLNAIEVEGLHGGAKISLTDRIKFAFNYTQDTWSGATPRINIPVSTEGIPTTIASASPKIHDIRNGTAVIDANNDIRYLQGTDLNGNPLFSKATWVNVLSAASPETRKQGDFQLSYQWDETEISAGGGISVENDYESRFGNLSLRQDFNQKQTAVNLGLSYTNSDTSAKLDNFDLRYIDINGYKDQVDNLTPNDRGGLDSAILRGNRQDWAAALGLTQILNKDALVEAGVAYTRSTGFMNNPYKSVMIAYVDPLDIPDASGFRPVYIRPVLEKRPNQRSQWTLGARYIQHINPFDAALHVGYSFYHDDWGINAHTFDADWVQPVGDGWTVTPRVRYYSQEAADFYQSSFLMNRKSPDYGTTFGSSLSYDPNNYPANYSSDSRLSGYGTLSGGVTIAKQFAKGLSLEAGFEYYTRAGSLKLGGGGEVGFANLNYWVANAALKVNLSALGQAVNSGVGTDGHNGHGHHHNTAPAGVLFSHMLDKADGFMVGYRYMRNRDAGELLHGTKTFSGDAAIVNNSCPVDSGGGCAVSPTEMTMNMHMLDLMYAPTAWLNLMLMPQFVDMEMTMRGLEGAPVSPVHHHGGNPNASHGHTTGGVGDTGMYALFKLFDEPVHHVHLGLGVSAPTGDVGIRLRKLATKDISYIHYGMQLGSGTWDFKPSLTYTGQTGSWAWGGQLSGTKRLEDINKSGYALGDIFQSTIWGSHSLTDWLSASVRGVYTWQGVIKGQYNRESIDPDHICIRSNYGTQEEYQACLAPLKLVQNLTQRSTPMDQPSNYGGQYVDLGLGLNVNIPNGAFAGNSLSFEWLQPVYTNVNGYQLDRDGALAVNWNYAF